MAKSLDVLLVEDDELFRATIKRSLEKKGCEVTEAANGKMAKEMMLLHKFSLILSDIQMPHFTGVDLLEWVKETVPTPMILMTGFSQALETKRAHEVGADGFLAKPFKETDLFEILAPYLEPEKEIPSEELEEDLDKDFCKVAVEDFMTEKEVEFDIYLRISNAKYIKIAHSGGKLSEDRVLAYQEKGIQFVYVKRESFHKVVDFNLQVAKVAKKSALNKEKKLSFMRHTAELILENAFVNGVNSESFRESKDFIETSMEMLTEDDKVFTILEILSTHADFLYAHSLGVSAFSVMIGKEMGWNSSPTLFKLALGGLFHDIGKKEVAKEILDKPRPLLTQKERSIIESHPTRGKEILESLGNIPSEVVLIAYQHHEDLLGQGFPRGLQKNKIHPMARVVSVANIFCEYTIKSHADMKVKTAAAALSTMEQMRGDAMDKDAFLALKRLFA